MVDWMDIVSDVSQAIQKPDDQLFEEVEVVLLEQEWMELVLAWVEEAQMSWYWRSFDNQLAYPQFLKSKVASSLILMVWYNIENLPMKLSTLKIHCAFYYCKLADPTPTYTKN